MPRLTPEFDSFIEKHCNGVLTRKTPTGTITTHLSGPRRYHTREEMFRELPAGFIERQDWRWDTSHTVWVNPDEYAFVMYSAGLVTVEICSSDELYWYRLREREKTGGP